MLEVMQFRDCLIRQHRWSVSG